MQLLPFTSPEGKASASSYVFKAALEGKYAKSENLHWFANGQEVKEAAGHTTVTVSASAITSGSYKIYAVVVYNDCAVFNNGADKYGQPGARLQLKFRQLFYFFRQYVRVLFGEQQV